MKSKQTRIDDGVAALILIGLLWVSPLHFSAHAQQPARPPGPAPPVTSGTLQLGNGKLEVRALSGPLSDAVNRWATGTLKAAWLGYSVAEVGGNRSGCCGNGRQNRSARCGPCFLDGRANSENTSSHDSNSSSKVDLTGPQELAILFRAESGKITKIRVLPIECKVDSGGLGVVWLQGVKSADSVGLLEPLVQGADWESGSGESLGQNSLAAIAIHADPAADHALQTFVARAEPASLRREAAFWLGEARGAAGLQILQKMAKSDPSPEVREQVTFALSVSKEPGALPEMIRMAREDESSAVRGQALFWLGEKAGQKASQAITGSIENDPDTEVKKKAVFALSQMPPEQGVPRLIQVAQSNRNPQVRKEAMFWLGQSEDPQALAFFERLLGQQPAHSTQ